MAVLDAAHAAGDTATKARPGVADRAFCEPPTATSTPQASHSNGTAPTLDTLSTTRSTPAARVIRPTASTSWITAVDVSLCCIRTALVGASANAASTSAGCTAWPHS